MLAFGCVQLVGKSSGIAGKAELFVGFDLVPSFGACRAGSVKINYVRVPSCWAVGAILLCSTDGYSCGPCGLSFEQVRSGVTTKSGVSIGRCKGCLLPRGGAPNALFEGLGRLKHCTTATTKKSPRINMGWKKKKRREHCSKIELVLTENEKGK
jgi:hypothetical protein